MASNEPDIVDLIASYLLDPDSDSFRQEVDRRSREVGHVLRSEDGLRRLHGALGGRLEQQLAPSDVHHLWRLLGRLAGDQASRREKGEEPGAEVTRLVWGLVRALEGSEDPHERSLADITRWLKGTPPLPRQQCRALLSQELGLLSTSEQRDPNVRGWLESWAMFEMTPRLWFRGQSSIAALAEDGLSYYARKFQTDPTSEEVHLALNPKLERNDDQRLVRREDAIEQILRWTTIRRELAEGLLDWYAAIACWRPFFFERLECTRADGCEFVLKRDLKCALTLTMQDHATRWRKTQSQPEIQQEVIPSEHEEPLTWLPKVLRGSRAVDRLFSSAEQSVEFLDHRRFERRFLRWLDELLKGGDPLELARLVNEIARTPGRNREALRYSAFRAIRTWSLRPVDRDNPDTDLVIEALAALAEAELEMPLEGALGEAGANRPYRWRIVPPGPGAEEMVDSEELAPEAIKALVSREVSRPVRDAKEVIAARWRNNKRQLGGSEWLGTSDG